MLARLLAGAVDRAFSSAVLTRSRRGKARSKSESLGPLERLRQLDRVRATYDRPEHFDGACAFFPAPRAPEAARLEHVRDLGHGGGRGEVVDATWPSAITPFDPALSERYLAVAENRTAAARLFVHGDRPRPAAILVHGYRFGHFAVEERVWPVARLFALGFDVALAVLPFHAVRARPGPPLFPSSDPRITVEGLRQAVFDLGTLAALLRDRGAPAVGVMGMSLGAYASALLATLEPGLAFLVPIIPVASLADMARDGGRFVGTPAERVQQHEALEAAYRVASPLARPSLVAPARSLVLAGEADRVTPIAHARRLAAHLGADLVTFPGGHLVQVGRDAAFAKVEARLAPVLAGA
jgi:pimeloyl-ACP methyl ester carboxylesterase